jgi:hypothetical protein
MVKASLVFGALSVGLFFVAIFASRILVQSEDDWIMGVALALCAGAALSIGMVGGLLSVVAICRKSDKPLLALAGLVLNLIPALFYLSSWMTNTVFFRH